MASSLQSNSLRPLSIDPSVTSKSFVGLKSQWSGAFGHWPTDASAGFHVRVHESFSRRLPAKRASRGRIYMMPINTPQVMYRTPGAPPYPLDLWNVLYRKRIIFIGQYLDEAQSNQILATMLYLDTIDSSEDLSFYITGYGGELNASLAVYDTMRSLRSAVATWCLGLAYNMSGFLVAAGNKGKRAALPRSHICLEAPYGSARGKAEHVRSEANELLRVRDHLFRELAKQTDQPLEKIYKDLRQRKYFGTKEAMEYGLIDRISRPRSIMAHKPRDRGTGSGKGLG